MRFRLALLAVTLATLGTSAVSAGAQTLADIARKEQERRKTVKDVGKVYTNKDLEPVPLTPSTAAPATGDAAKDAAAAKGADASKGAAGDGTAKPAEAPKDQKYWADRMTALQTQLQRDQTFARAIEVQIGALTTDFINRDDPAQRDVIAQDRRKALDELARLQKAIEDDKKAIADFEEEARRAGVPPGWLR
jgi:hypothetical protein